MKNVKLIDVCMSITDGDHQSPPKTAQGIPFITISNIVNNQISFKDTMYVSEDYYNNLSNEKKATTGDILYSVVGSYGKPVYIDNDEKFVFQRHIAILRPNDQIDGRYLYYTMLNPSFYNQISNLVIGCVQKTLTLDSLRNLSISVPTLHEQINISKTLGTIDQKIQLNNKINQELEEMAKTLYDYWFVQFDFPDEQGKLYRSSGGKMVFCEELNREIPEGWGVKKIGDILGKIPNTKRIQTSDYKQCGDLPIIDQSTNFIAGFTSDISTKLSFEKGCIIFGDHTRIVKFINFDFARGADGTQVLVSKERNISEIQLYFIVKSIDLSNYGYARHFKFLKDKPVIIPNTEVHTIFNEKAEAMFARIGKNTFENEELITLRDWLLPMLMNGQAVVE